MTFGFDRTDDYDSDNYLDHADEFMFEKEPIERGADAGDVGGLEPRTFEAEVADDAKPISGGWHRAEYTVEPGEKPTLMVDGEEVEEIESIGWDDSRTPDEDDPDDTIAFNHGGSVIIDGHVCQNCGLDIGALSYEIVNGEEERRTNYCSGCGKPVEEVLDL